MCILLLAIGALYHDERDRRRGRAQRSIEQARADLIKGIATLEGWHKRWARYMRDYAADVWPYEEQHYVAAVKHADTLPTIVVDMKHDYTVIEWHRMKKRAG